MGLSGFQFFTLGQEIGRVSGKKGCRDDRLVNDLWISVYRLDDDPRQTGNEGESRHYLAYFGKASIFVEGAEQLEGFYRAAMAFLETIAQVIKLLNEY